ncbi:UDP-N-acetylmuramate-alanine ligase [Pelotomaculum thermopropionicum SI]|uniref:UDP-N-acetylmuramate--L-alanine ligase n=1 Tax=Pelotomaculum thermopropionicum (strain DSM 13744 / JCM 10971 / SI) TaxID=370438 RepID=MURC_PELTS|nr:RecName: Full=UDP-N-acetylmuramate--L-alanine ligase; AltName: Full=UDP-N-acetylmuramoyl-L-alanine synthetase [Pelotomaculum thermopropionicum SI]BAF60041.1 UDP-N-acetylmuramate-alanine ligase [Pelotomaculum thermopropionicum SI]
MDKKRHVHFIGIGGSGMNGIAAIMLGLGYRVTGSDLKPSAATRRLEALGATCYTRHAEENLGDADLVVASTAIPPDNIELVEARKRGLPVMHRADLLAWLMRRQKGIAVAGAHGKTTTTSMTALVLEKNGMDPTIVIGGELSEIGGNAKLGRGEYLVAEADESDGSFLKLDPVIEIITNIEDDHLDYYRSVENILAAFRRFMAKVPESGLAVACLDDPRLRELLAGYDRPCLTYALDNPEADYTMRNIRLMRQVTAGDVYYRGGFLGCLELSVPGRHNLSNAMAAVAVGRFVGLAFEGIAAALKDFRGAGRRFQLTGEVNGIKVIDDYAHHPSEIKATLKAAGQVKTGRVVGVFQPHRYTRTLFLGERFGEAFEDADVVIISDIYSAGEKPIEGVSAKTIVSAIEKHNGRKVIYLPTRQEIVDYLVQMARPGDMILTMGAGDIWSAGIELVKRLKENQKIG